MTYAEKNMEEFKRLLYTKPDKKAVLGVLKSEKDIDFISKFVRLNNSHPVVNKFFFGELFPKSLKALGSGFYTTVSTFEKELQIQALALTKFSGQINDFINLKMEFDRLFLAGEFKTSETYLDVIEAKFGFSIWLIENRFMVYERTGGLKANKNYLFRINDESNSGLVTTLSHYLSLKAEERTTASNYLTKINILTIDLSKEMGDFLRTILNFPNEVQTIDEYAEVISYFSILSLIDRYLCFMKLAQQQVFTNSDANKQTVAASLDKVKKVINDPVLDNLSIFYGLDTDIEGTKIQREICTAFEAYTKGDYLDVLTQIKGLLREGVFEFGLIEIYCKSKLHVGDWDSSVSDQPESPINQIVDHVMALLKRDEFSASALSYLDKTALLLNNTRLGIQLTMYTKTFIQEGTTDNHMIFRMIQSFKSNPWIYKLFPDPLHSLRFLQAIVDCGYKNVGTLFKNSITFALTPDLVEVPEYRYRFHRASALMALMKHQEALLELEKVLAMSSLPAFIKEDTMIQLFDCYFATQDISKFVSMYVRTYINNPTLVSRIKIRDMHRRMEANRFGSLRIDIMLPIFYKITDQNNQIVNVTIRRFLKELGIRKPSEIVNDVLPEENKLVRFFLFVVCQPEVLKYFPFFRSTKEILEERLFICQRLISIDKGNEDLYNSEIGRIVQNMVILEGIKQVDESKIYVDEKGLRVNELKDVRSNFNRYLEISELVQNVSVLFIDQMNNKKFLVNIAVDKYSNDVTGKSALASDVKFELFKELFFEIRDAFLFNNKYGLDSYLSTRIRHGTLLGQIRRVFQDANLITQRENEADQYAENIYWTDKLELLEYNIILQIQEHLAWFSSEIDDLTTDLKDKVIQIKTDPENPNGLFDYTYPVANLKIAFNVQMQYIKDYDEFLDLVFKFLWDQTSISLEVIRHHISVSVKGRYFQILDDLQLRLKSLHAESIEFQVLLNKIISCRTSIDYELEMIANWFQIKETSIDDFNIVKAVDTSLEITNKFTINTKIQNITKNIHSSTLLKGTYFIPLFDFFRIFFENIVQHANIASDELNVSVNITDDGSKLYIQITNTMNSDLDISTLRMKFDTIRQGLSSTNWDMEKIKKEKGTGFYKAKKILIADLLNEKNEISISVNSENQVEVLSSISLNEIKC